jgi:hypothetical protein
VPDPLDPRTYNQLTSGSSSLFSGGPPPPGPSFPGLGFTSGRAPSGPLEAALQAVLPLVSEYARNQLGGFGFTFGGQRDLYSSYDNREFFYGLQRARTAAVPADVNRLDDILRGGYRAMGGELDARSGQAVRRIAERGGELLPILAAAFPEMIDQALGSTGSRIVAAPNFYMAGRFLTDASGRTREIDSNEVMNVALDRLYGTGRPGDPVTTERTRGLGAGRISSAFAELSQRGVIGGFTGDPATLGRQAADQLERYASAIAVVRDVFGDIGRPDAPMAEILKGLDTITRGGVGVYDPGRLAQTAGQFRAAARLSPLGYSGLLQFQELGAQLGDAYGLMPGLTGESWRLAFASTQAFRGTFSGVTGPELLNQEQFAAERLRLRAAGQASQTGNLIGAVLGLERFAAPGSAFAKLAQALGRGETGIEIGGQRIDLATTQIDELERLAQAGGLAPGALTEQLQYTRSNQARMVDRPESARAIDALQRAEIEQTIARGLTGGRPGIRDAEGTARTVMRLMQARSFRRGDVDVPIRGVDDVAEAVGLELGLDRQGQVSVASAIRQAGLVTGDDLAVFQRGRVMGDQTGAAEAGALAQLRREGKSIEDITGLARGTPAQRLADYLAFLAKPPPAEAVGALGGGIEVAAMQAAKPEIPDILKALAGFVSNETVQQRTGGALGAPGAGAPGAAPVNVKVSNDRLTVVLTDTAGQLRAFGTAAFDSFIDR